jgi:hypothetical protein
MDFEIYSPFEKKKISYKTNLYVEVIQYIRKQDVLLEI